MPPFTGGAIAPGLYRAVKGTRECEEATPGACAGVTPPAETPFATELELRPTRYAVWILGSATSGTWRTAGNVLTLTQSCPDAKPESGVPYTGPPDTVRFRASKQDFVSGGCRWWTVYELAQKP